MKAEMTKWFNVRLACALLVLLVVAVQLPAQQPTRNAVGTNNSDWEPVTPSGTNTAAAIPDWATNDTSGSINSAGTNKTSSDDIFVQIALGLATNANATSLTNANAGFAASSAAGHKADIERQFGGAPELLGWMYENGKEVSQDYAEAAKWYRKAAEQGNSDAQFKLGVMYDNGKGVPQDYVEAAKWYRKAAEQGVIAAQYNLGLMYSNGQGLPQDDAEADKWYRKAAEQGSPEAQYNLGVRYEDGKGVMQDYAEAAKWYGKAAEQGLPAAQNNLGLMYKNGLGLPQDYIEAYKWYNLATAKGDSDAKKNRDVVVRHMTPEQIAEAQRLSREFKPRQESGSDNSASPDSPTASGTGFFITDDGYLISNYHVVKDATRVRVVTRSGTVPAKVVQVDEANDIALLKVDGQFAVLPVASSRAVALGGTVATVGFPDPGLQGFSPKLAKGEIAALAGAGDNARYFQISVPVQPGNSGGALVDERGNVVGIVSAKLDASVALAASGALPENVNYAVKSSFLLGFLESVPEVSAKLKEPNTQDEKFEDVVKSAQQAAVLVLVY